MLFPHAVAPVLLHAKSPALVPVIGNGVKWRTLACLLVTVTVNAELVSPTSVAGSDSADLESVTGAIPVPLNAAVSGVALALVVTLSVPAAWANSPAGVRTRAILHVALCASDALVAVGQV